MRSKVLTLQVKARRKTRKVIAVRQLGSTPVRLVRTTSRKAPKIKVLGLVRIILVTLAVRESNLIASRRLLFVSFGVPLLARLIPCFVKSHQNPSKINRREVRSSFDGADFFENKVLDDGYILILPRKELQLSEKSARQNQFCSTPVRLMMAPHPIRRNFLRILT